MRKALIFIVLFILALVFIVGVIRLVSGPEDDWICSQNGEWVEHGHPSTSKPTGTCPR